PRPSAHPLEVDDAGDGVFSGQPHASIQNQGGILDHVAGLMTAVALDLGRFRKPDIRIGIETDDLWEAETGAEVRLETNQPASAISVVVTDADTGAEVARVDATAGEEDRTVEMPGVPPGAYRVTATADDTSVTDVVLA